jgi:Carboxypeptidase regulatory-like domain
MIIRSIWVGFVVLVLCIASALAAASVLRGVVKDPEGNPIKAAEVRIETKNGGKLIETVRTDENGRYISGGLPAGNYRITLLVNGAVKTSINNTTLHSDQPTQLNFDLTSKSVSSTAKKGTHLVWVPPFTGSRLPGRWIEVDDNRSWAGAHVSTENVVQISGEELQRTIHSVTIKRGQ